MDLISNEIVQEAQRLMISTYAAQQAIADTLSINNPKTIQMEFPLVTPTGMTLKFVILTSKLTADVVWRCFKQATVASNALSQVECTHFVTFLFFFFYNPFSVLLVV